MESPESTGKSPMPSMDDVNRMWQELHFERLSVDNPAIEKLLAAFRALYLNGGALHACFTVPNHDVSDWSVVRDRLDEIDLSRFLTSQAVRTSLPELRIEGSFLDEPDFEPLNPAALSSELAETIMAGGAYEQFMGTPQEARAWAQEFCDAVFDHRFHEVRVFRSWRPWSAWFHDVAWDQSWLIVDLAYRRLWLLCVTDTD